MTFTDILTVILSSYGGLNVPGPRKVALLGGLSLLENVSHCGGGLLPVKEDSLLAAFWWRCRTLGSLAPCLSLLCQRHWQGLPTRALRQEGPKFEICWSYTDPGQHGLHKETCLKNRETKIRWSRRGGWCRRGGKEEEERQRTGKEKTKVTHKAQWQRVPAAAATPQPHPISAQQWGRGKSDTRKGKKIFPVIQKFN